MCAEFQSTHPVWGATPLPAKQIPLDCHFNPRTPCGVRPLRQAQANREAMISIHAPRVGCDLGAFSFSEVQHISIHAPRVGCDVFDYLRYWVVGGISIHAPRVGCDHQTRLQSSLHQLFQSTHPVWGATCTNLFFLEHAPQFQSTHPVWGATTLSGPGSPSPSYFNPRTPCGVRRVPSSANSFISLHFNPRTPCGVRLV